MSDTTTLYFYNGVAMPYDSLPPAQRELVDQAWQAYQQQQPKHRSLAEKSYLPAALTLFAFAVVAYVLIKKAWQDKTVTILPGAGDRRSDRYAVEDRQRQLLSDYFVYEGRDIVIPETQYEKILSKYSPYYRKLSPGLKEKFISRTEKFLSSKTFLIKSNEPFIEMPVLISSAAVQLTFGLDNCLLPHYQYIRVYPEEYFAEDTLHVLAGHVYGNTITLAWNQFLKGNEEYDDGVNVGLHEMAHALYFQHVHADAIKSRSFVSHFNKVMAEGEEMYELKRNRPSELFSQNAYRDLQEFWAESIEIFFERPSDLKRENAELYDALKEILNQDPVNTLYPVIE